MACTHPDHVEGVSCEDRAVACGPSCTCCLTAEAIRAGLIRKVTLFWAGFYRCPNTGRILEAMRGDNKVLCNCGRSNPKVPQERTEQTATHIISFLEPASAAEYVDAKY